MPLDGADTTSVEWTITDSERAAFATFSGDHNPIHTDPVAARRLIGGRMIVHGAHLLLAALDQAVSRGHVTAGPATIDARFLHGVPPDRPLVTTIDQSDDGMRLSVVYDVWPSVEIIVRPSDEVRPEPAIPAVVPLRPPAAQPDDVPFEDLGEVHGAVAAGDDQAARRLFPAASNALGPGLVAEIAALSRVVGMHAPGRRSLSSRYRIAATNRDTGTSTVRFEVVRLHGRTRRVDVDVDGDHLVARLEAFSPQGPVDQHVELTGARRPTSHEFAGRRVLVIGGSRGLGAATAVLLRAGGADVRVAARTSSDWRFDARDGASGLDRITADGWRPTSLCWFATPPYGDGRRGAHSERHTAELIAVQVEAFVEVVDRLRGRSQSLVAALWPSASTGTSELLAAKRAGEAAAEGLRRRHDGLTVVAPRLPTMLTDQTRSLLPIDYSDTADTLLAVLRQLPG